MSDSKPTLVIQQTEHMSRATFEAFMKHSKGYAEELGFNVVSVPLGIRAHIEHGTADLVAAIHAQTAAIQELAESNKQVIDYLLSQEIEDSDGGGAPSPYLDPDEAD